MKKNHENQLQSKLTQKQDKSFLEIIPNTIKNLPREQKPYMISNNFKNDYSPPNIEVKMFPEWPGNEEVNVINYF